MTSYGRHGLKTFPSITPFLPTGKHEPLLERLPGCVVLPSVRTLPTVPDADSAALLIDPPFGVGAGRQHAQLGADDEPAPDAAR